MKSLYCTADTIGTETGGGVVTYNELLALKGISSEITVIERKDIEPTKFHQVDSPFLEDYFALEQIKDKHFDLAHFYAGCFSATIRWLKSRGTKVSYTIAAHDRKVSIEEFGRLGLEYPFHNISDDDLFNIYIEGQKLADMVIAPSTKSAQLLKSEGCKKVVVIPHGCVLPKQVKPIPERFDVGYLGAVGPDKSLIDLIRAWAMLNYSDSTLILAGSGTETLEPFIRQISNRGQFKILGRVPDISNVYNSCSVYVQPSCTEGFGIEVLEAMSYGRPVIVTEGVGAKDCVKNGITGFIIPIRSPQDIAGKIDCLKQNRETLLEMGARARIEAKQYAWNKIRKCYSQIWLEL
ncbi:N,N'-diacetylbacillosaminyl-diphospho-undecaprenol alpha-1,3-N-acetylgalactosaminyltransferase [subsurface metagenome]